VTAAPQQQPQPVAVGKEEKEKYTPKKHVHRTPLRHATCTHAHTCGRQHLPARRCYTILVYT